MGYIAGFVYHLDTFFFKKHVNSPGGKMEFTFQLKLMYTKPWVQEKNILIGSNL